MSKRKDEQKNSEPQPQPEPQAQPSTNGEAGGLVAEQVAVELVHQPFDPKRVELAFHKRVDGGFLEYASYVIRDRAIPNLSDGLKPVLEIHLLDFDRNVYGERVTVNFLHKLRDEEKYATLELLKEHIARDVENVRKFFIARSPADTSSNHV